MERETNVNINIVEKELKPFPGMVMLIAGIFGILVCIALCIFGGALAGTFGPLPTIVPIILLIIGILGLIIIPILLCGLRIVNPNEALVLTLFGSYLEGRRPNQGSIQRRKLLRVPVNTVRLNYQKHSETLSI